MSLKQLCIMAHTSHDTACLFNMLPSVSKRLLRHLYGGERNWCSERKVIVRKLECYMTYKYH